MKKNGFTLVELLAVIAILAILVIIAMPNVLDMFNKAKKDVFVTETQSLVGAAKKGYIFASGDEKTFCKSATDEKNPLSVDGKEKYYYVKVKKDGTPIYLIVWDDSYYISKYNSDGFNINTLSDIDVNEITDITGINCNNVVDKLADLPIFDSSKISLNISAPYYGSTSISYNLGGVSNVSNMNKVTYKLYKDGVLFSEDTVSNKSENFKFTKDNVISSYEVASIVFKVEVYDEFSRLLKSSTAEYNAVCFVAGTKVKTEYGYKNIEDIKTGDKVYSYNLDTNTLEVKEVLDTYISKAGITYKMTVGNKEVEMSQRHELYIIDKGWVRAFDVKEGDKMLSADGNIVEITNIQKIEHDKPVTTYNFKVDGNANYFVTDIQVLVHNAGSPI